MKKNNKIHDINEYKKLHKNNYRNRKLNKSKKKVLIFLLFIGSSSMIIVNLSGYSKISQLKYDIHYLKEDLKKKEIVLEELKAKSETNQSIQQIEKKAKEELNMDYPKKDQIEYIEIDN